jgi:hypothetical protein
VLFWHSCAPPLHDTTAHHHNKTPTPRAATTDISSSTITLTHSLTTTTSTTTTTTTQTHHQGGRHLPAPPLNTTHHHVSRAHRHAPPLLPRAQLTTTRHSPPPPPRVHHRRSFSRAGSAWTLGYIGVLSRSSRVSHGPCLQTSLGPRRWSSPHRDLLSHRSRVPLLTRVPRPMTSQGHRCLGSPRCNLVFVRERSLPIYISTRD